VKLDLDLVRELALFLEAKETTKGVPWDEISIPEWSAHQIGYHLVRMYEAGYINGEVVRSKSTHERIISVHPFDLTWEGHQFLETVRDPVVWRKTKEGAKKVGGVGIEFIFSIAKAYGRHLIKEKIGIDV
jgi:hypothetical protein